MSAPATVYDQVRYPGKFYPQASPERLATLATLYGLQPPSVEHCRVLEMGCGEGANLVPLAYLFPESSFLGCDLSQQAVERGQQLVQRLGLKNVELRAQDLMEFPADSGTFDYILSHGVLTWVPEEVRQQMLEICARHLAPRGVVYLSYSTLPGGYLRNYARDLIRFHTRLISEPGAKTREARNIAEFVVSAIETPTLERELIKREMKPYEGKDSFLYHDLLADVNDPIYFLDFMDAASRCALQFICESHLGASRTADLPEAVRQQLDAMPERLAREQYLDFIRGRRFRQTVLCRAGHDLDLEVTLERMERLLICCAIKPAQAAVDARGAEEIEFHALGGRRFRTAEPVPKATYLALGEAYPRGLRFSELCHEICHKLGVDGLSASDQANLIRMLVSAFSNYLVELHVHQFQFCTSVSDRPAASRLARLQAESEASAVSLDLRPIALDNGLTRTLLPLLDGTRDIQGLMLDLAGRTGASVSEENLHKALELLARSGMLAA